MRTLKLLLLQELESINLPEDWAMAVNGLSEVIKEIIKTMMVLVQLFHNKTINQSLKTIKNHFNNMFNNRDQKIRPSNLNIRLEPKLNTVV